MRRALWPHDVVELLGVSDAAAEERLRELCRWDVCNEAVRAVLLNAEPATGVIYFVTCGTGLVKIGYSRNLEQRLATMRSDCPMAVELLAAVPGTRGLERRLHGLYSHLRERGEWFRAVGELLFAVATFAEFCGEGEDDA